MNLPAARGGSLRELVDSYCRVQPTTLMVSVEKEKVGDVHVKDLASHRLTWVIAEVPVLLAWTVCSLCFNDPSASSLKFFALFLIGIKQKRV